MTNKLMASESYWRRRLGLVQESTSHCGSQSSISHDHEQLCKQSALVGLVSVQHADKTQCATFYVARYYTSYRTFERRQRHQPSTFESVELGL
jgi:hypothetical protein